MMPLGGFSDCQRCSLSSEVLGDNLSAHEKICVAKKGVGRVAKRVLAIAIGTMKARTLVAPPPLVDDSHL